MSIYATVAESEPVFFSSNTGWLDVSEWIDGLDEKQFPAVVHLADHGFTDNAAELAEQLQLALSEHSPTSEVAATISELLDLLAGESGEVIIDSGIETDDSSESVKADKNGVRML